MSLYEAERRIKQNKAQQDFQLDLSNLSLSEIPSGILELTHLTQLNLSDNQLKVLPHALVQLPELQNLSLNNNRLNTLPHVITQLTNLQSLNLNRNRLTTLPIEFSQLTALKRLYLRENQLVTLPECVIQLVSLQRLDISTNQLTVLPQSIGHLKGLQMLDLSTNQFTDVPKSITQLHNLVGLDVSKNMLIDLHDHVTRLIKLTGLYLGSNQITELSDSVTNLKNLQILDISSNRITKLPESITQLRSLSGLILRDNPLKDPPLEIALQGIDSIRTYFSERINNDPDEIGLYESKLLLVGEGRVGKTSLSKALRITDYKLEDEQSTEGIDIQTWTIPRAETGLEEDFRLNVWDFGGQEIYHATHQFFLTRRSLYLFVTESRREDKHDDFYYWFNIIRLLGDNAPVVVVLNKCDQPTKELPIEEYRKAFNNIIHYEKVSCTKDYRHTIEGLKHAIHKILTNRELMPHIGDRLPGVWLRIRKDLAKLREQNLDYIDYEEFIDVCARHGMCQE